MENRVVGQTSPEKPAPEKRAGQKTTASSGQDWKQTGGRDQKPELNSGLKPEDKQKFLEALAAGASVRSATASIGAKPDEPYRWREEDTEFALRWRHAEEAGTDLIEDEAYRRAVKGVEKPVYRGGEVVGHVADYSDTMLMFLLKARRPERYSAKAGDGPLDAETLAKRLNLKGARDALIGWTCGLALAWHFLGFDIANWLRIVFFPETPAPPALNGTETLVTVLLSMLGLGGLRTVEKLKGVGRDGWK